LAYAVPACGKDSTCDCQYSSKTPLFVGTLVGNALFADSLFKPWRKSSEEGFGSCSVDDLLVGGVCFASDNEEGVKSGCECTNVFGSLGIEVHFGDFGVGVGEVCEASELLAQCVDESVGFRDVVPSGRCAGFVYARYSFSSVEGEGFVVEVLPPNCSWSLKVESYFVDLGKGIGEEFFSGGFASRLKGGGIVEVVVPVICGIGCDDAADKGFNFVSFTRELGHCDALVWLDD